MSLTYEQFRQRLEALPASARSVEDFLRLYFFESAVGSNQFDMIAKAFTSTSHTTGTSVADSYKVDPSAAAPSSPTQGQFWWDADEETISFKQDGAILQLGQETQYHARNNSGADIANGKPVMATGTLGNSGRITIGLMDGSSPTNAKYFLGVTTEAITDDTDGKVTHFGKVRGVNTTGAMSFGGAETWNDGDILYIDPANVGYFTNVAPTSPNLKMAAAIVVHAHSNGTMFVRVNNLDLQSAFGDRENGNYSEFEADGTLKFNGNATVYDDLPPVKLSTVKLTGAGTDPARTSFVGNISQLTFAINDFIPDLETEVLHAYKEGSDISIHIHWATNGTEVTDAAVKWEIEYTVANGSGTAPFSNTFPASVTSSSEITIPANTGDRAHIISNIGTIDGSSLKIGAYIIFNIKRIAATGTAPAADPFAIAVGFHAEQDTTGSRQLFIK